MEIQHVNGRDAGPIFLYALSTCGWCRRTKQLLKDLDVAFSYVDVDLLEGRDQEQVADEVRRWNPAGSFPTLVVDNRECVVGYDEARIREVIAS